MFSLTNLFGKAVMYLVIALWKLEKPIVRKAPSEKLGEKAISNI